ncbi:MAG: dTMP kinase [Gammaproteobacteria bacterium]|jgi:dTMP kinase|nr:dTMP kinase [Gammaproteobacteria bacterium]
MSIEKIPMKKGYFITLEGIEGAGKSTALGYISNSLLKAKIPFIQTREPGGTMLAEAIRQILLTPTEELVSPDTELLLMFASRAQHIHQVILPALRAGKWVVSDRFTDATYAYQGGGRGILEQRIAQMESWVQGELRPDCTLLLDLPVDLGMQRVKARKGRLDRIEKEKYAFFERVRANYLERAKKNPSRCHIINAAQEIQLVEREVCTIIQNMIDQQ